VAKSGVSRETGCRGRSLQLRQELAVWVSLANENDDVVALLSEDETEDVGDASNEILEGLAVRSRMRHLNTPPTWRCAKPAICNVASDGQSREWHDRFKPTN
jgi:hypothetical protein